jgi:predicted phosphodiesterase
MQWLLIGCADVRLCMRHGVIADLHGNEVALRAVLDDAASCGVDRWWALGDLVLFGPRPAEVLGLLLDTLMSLPSELRLNLPDGTRVLGVHASPSADDGPGIEPGISDQQLGRLLAGCAADIVIGGHTHSAADRVVGGIRALNPGSVGIPERPGQAGWLLLEPTAEYATRPANATANGLRAEHRTVAFDVDAVVRDLRARLHPNAEFLEAVLTGKRRQRAARDAGSGCPASNSDAGIPSDFAGRAVRHLGRAWDRGNAV